MHVLRTCHATSAYHVSSTRVTVDVTMDKDDVINKISKKNKKLMTSVTKKTPFLAVKLPSFNELFLAIGASPSDIPYILGKLSE
ncbi:hypothetical protein GIB67_000624 [Kingdonia uniflora]|uniref:Uncharacterized protein n=1 Tax=Kingdonia uniflora TaxID=39325 RepID=A0A7J7NDF5_9MAGN|nr:hypothetical protein GIB67_000624 [Kingdonia uniflora]